MIHLSYEIFHPDIDALVDFYTQVLDFHPRKPDSAADYIVVRRGSVQVGYCRLEHADPTPRRPPNGSEVVVRVDDIQADYDRVLTSCWSLADPLQDRPSGMRDYRLFDPSGQYLRITKTTCEEPMNSHA